MKFIFVCVYIFTVYESAQAAYIADLLLADVEHYSVSATRSQTTLTTCLLNESLSLFSLPSVV